MNTQGKRAGVGAERRVGAEAEGLPRWARVICLWTRFCVPGAPTRLLPVQLETLHGRKLGDLPGGPGPDWLHGSSSSLPFPFSHHVIKPKDISWWYFSSKNENQAGVIPTENKKHTNVKPSSDGQETRTSFLPVNADKLMCAFCSHTYCIEEAAVNLWKLPVAPWLNVQKGEIDIF